MPASQRSLARVRAVRPLFRACAIKNKRQTPSAFTLNILLTPLPAVSNLRGMTGKIFANVLAILLFVAVTNAFSQDKVSTQYVLMKNGHAVSGTVESLADQTVVVKPSGSRLVLDNNKIRTIVNSLGEIYWFKCASLSATDSEGHSALFYWCIENKLFVEAQNQIDLMQAMRISPRRMLVMYDKLQATKKEERARVERERFAMQSLPTQPKVPEGVIRQASFEEEVVDSEQVASSKSAEAKPNDFFATDLSVGFNKQPQPAKDTPSPAEPAKATNLANVPRLPKSLIKKVTDTSDQPAVTQVDPFDPEVFNRLYLDPDSPPT